MEDGVALEDVAASAAADHVVPFFDDAPPEEFVYNNASDYVHRVVSVGVNKLVCGKKMPINFTLMSVPPSGCSRCTGCF